MKKVITVLLTICLIAALTACAGNGSGSSGIGMSGKNLEENAGSGNWKDGDRFDSGTSEDDLREWIDGIM